MTARFAVELSGAWNYAFNRFDTPLRIGCTSPALAIWSTSFRRNSTTPWIWVSFSGARVILPLTYTGKSPSIDR